MRHAIWPVLFLLPLACSQPQTRHAISDPASETEESYTPRMIDDFEKSLDHWHTWEATISTRAPTKVIENGTMRVDADDTASVLWRRCDFDPRTEPIITWRWRVSTMFDSDPMVPTRDNFPARFIVGFDAEWNNASPNALAFRKQVHDQTGMDLPARALCYTFGGNRPSHEGIDAAFADGRIVVINLRTHQDSTGVWYTETRDIARDYRDVFGEAPPDVSAIGFGIDNQRVNIPVTSWLDDIAVYPAAARRALAQNPSINREPNRLNLWLALGFGALAMAIGGAWVGLKLRHRK